MKKECSCYRRLSKELRSPCLVQADSEQAIFELQPSNCWECATKLRKISHIKSKTANEYFDEFTCFKIIKRFTLAVITGTRVKIQTINHKWTWLSLVLRKGASKISNTIDNYFKKIREDTWKGISSATGKCALEDDYPNSHQCRQQEASHHEIAFVFPD